MNFPDYYALLGVPRFYATQEEIRAAYLAQIKFFHPDAGNVPPEIATAKTQELNRVYATLRDTQNKRVYDEQLASAIYQESQRPKEPPKEEPAAEKPPEKPPRKRKRKGSWTAVVVLFAVLGILAFYETPAPKDATPAPTSSYASKVEPTPVTPPANGKIIYDAGLERISTLTIKTSGTKYYYVKLVDVYTGSTALSFFVHGGTTVDIDVPIGDYKLRYASGSAWYGNSSLLGPNATYYEADDTFDFTEHYGWTVELYLQHGGNLDIDVIDASDF